MTDNQKLNEKLSRFAGLEFKRHDLELGEHLVMTSTGYYFNDQFIRRGLPNFANDSSTQKNWLYPKLISDGCEFGIGFSQGVKNPTLQLAKEFQYTAWITNQSKDFADYVCGENPSLAFALVCEKYIDSLEVKKWAKIN